MQKQLLRILFFSVVLVTVGCNEKISPELQNGGSSSSTTLPPTVVPSEYYFKVTDTSNLLFGYSLHRSGLGNQSTPCKVSDTVALSNDNYRTQANIGLPHPSKVYDISCFFEAEELALFFGGFSFKVEASPNTCEYVGYSPFSFFDYIPGDSSTTYTKVNCDLTVTSALRATVPTAGVVGTDLIPNTSGRYGAGPSYIACGEAVDSSIAIASRAPITVLTDKDYCHFDYTRSGGPNCDPGVITVNDWVYKSDTSVTPAVAVDNPTLVTRIIRCGGLVSNCVKGPIRKSSVIPATFTRGTELTQSTKNATFSREISYASPESQKFITSKFYTNYRRGLSGRDLPAVFDESISLDTTNVAYDPSYYSGIKYYDPAILENYASNLNTPALFSTAPTVNLSQATYDTDKISQGYTAAPLALDPFVGWGIYKVNPYYTFYCFDKALETKARIRMVVREWDRTFSSTSDDLEVVSDVFGNLPFPIVSKMDVLPGVNDSEADNDAGANNSFNDVQDWDDLIPMSRNGTLWNPAGTTAPYPHGFYNPAYFTNGGY